MPPVPLVSPSVPALPSRPVEKPVVTNPWRPTESARDWKYIVLHHTASSAGDVESIHNAHLKNKDKNGKPWLGIGYHFVIGNGQGMDDGEIEPTFRWKQQMQGAHAGVTEYNQHGIGIVLIGNFEEQSPTQKQLQSVRRLVDALKQDYKIVDDKIIGHKNVKATECPGLHFPLDEVKLGVAQWNHEGSGVSPQLAGDAPVAVPVAQTSQKGILGP